MTLSAQTRNKMTKKLTPPPAQLQSHMQLEMTNLQSQCTLTSGTKYTHKLPPPLSRLAQTPSQAKAEKVDSSKNAASPMAYRADYYFEKHDENHSTNSVAATELTTTTTKNEKLKKEKMAKMTQAQLNREIVMPPTHHVSCHQ